MKITGVTTTSIPPGAGRRLTGSWVVEVGTDQGVVGLAVGATDVRTEVEAIAQAVLIGEDPRGVTGLWQRMVERATQSGRAQTFQEGISLLDFALWDVKAKANAEPLWKTLGGARPRINVHASAADSAIGDDALERWFAAMAAQYGIRAGKLSMSADPAADARRLGLVRAALATRTAEPVLMIDAEERWTAAEAIRRVRELEERFDLTWVEAPAPSTDAAALKLVSRSVSAAVCAGENLGYPSEFLPHFRERSLDVVQLGTRNGGVTGLLQLADSAFGFELPVALAVSPGNINAQLGAVLPSVMSLEVIEPLAHGEFLTTDVRIENGWAIAGDKPGHGLAFERSPK
ncbi:MAG: enolase C-terminal domain-like protein [Steroidobacterales bacterium]